MTVEELIVKLKSLPPDALVVAQGYEDGYDTVKEVSVLSVELSPQQEWWSGKYIESKESGALLTVFLDAKNRSEDK